MASNAETNIAKALELKAQGNEAFKAGDYKQAMVHYHQVAAAPPAHPSHLQLHACACTMQIYMYVHGFSEGSSSSGGQSMPGQTTKPVSPETMAQIKELKVVHFSNLAMCHMKLGNVQKARDNSSKALAIDGKHMKSLFRRGKCNAALGALDEAKVDLDCIMSMEPENRDALRELHALKQKFREHDKKEKKKFAGMFDRRVQPNPDPDPNPNPDPGFRLRRAEVLESQGYREKQINQSEGDRQSAINSSQVEGSRVGACALRRVGWAGRSVGV